MRPGGFAGLNLITTLGPSTEAIAWICRFNGKIKLFPSSLTVGRPVKRRSVRIAQKSLSTGRSKLT